MVLMAVAMVIVTVIIMAMVKVAMTGIDGDRAAGAGDCATHVLKLHSGMEDLKALQQDVVQLVKNAVAL